MLEGLVIVGGSALIAWISRRSLSRPDSHGFPRFFAFEALFVLVVLVASRWFDDPFCPRQIVSWTLLAASAALAAHGFRLLHAVGRPSAPAPGSPDLGIENTSVLVAVGAYRWLRHPLYASLVLLTWGTGLKRPSVWSLGLAACATAFLFWTARVEERENLIRFGQAYRRYMTRTWMFVPFVL